MSIFLFQCHKLSLCSSSLFQLEIICGAINTIILCSYGLISVYLFTTSRYTQVLVFPTTILNKLGIPIIWLSCYIKYVADVRVTGTHVTRAIIIIIKR